MKTKVIPVILSLLFVTCTKNDIHQKAQQKEVDVASDFQTPDQIPLNDLGTGTFHDSVGGLYPYGVNTPSGIYADDLLAISKTIVPIDSFGNPSSSTLSCIAFLSMGASTGGKNMTALINKTLKNPLCNPKLKLMNGNQPAQRAPLTFIIDTNNEYWQHVTAIITGHKCSNRQIQVLYLETDDSVVSVKFPDRANLLKAKLAASFRILNIKFPNLKLVYLLARTRTFSNTTTPWNTEPSPYYFGWACKWLIQDQINEVPEVTYKGPNKVAPMAAWGFYQWADSLPRTTDNFYWRYSETKDGLHANTAGQDTLSQRFQNFLLTDPNASIWYAKH